MGIHSLLLARLLGFVSLLLISVSAPAFASQDKAQLVLENSNEAPLSLSTLNIETAQLLEWHILHSTSKAHTRTVLMSLVYASLAEGAKGRCAAGEEHILLWAKINPLNTVENTQSVVYSSCLLSLEIVTPNDLIPPLKPADVKDGIKLISVDLSSETQRVIEYAMDKPHAGLTTR